MYALSAGGVKPVAPVGGEGMLEPLPHMSLLRLAFQGLGSQATLHQAVSGKEGSQKRAFYFDICRYR